MSREHPSPAEKEWERIQAEKALHAIEETIRLQSSGARIIDYTRKLRRR